MVQPLQKDTLPYQLTQIIDVNNAPEGHFNYAVSDSRYVPNPGYYSTVNNAIQTANYTITTDEITGNSILYVSNGVVVTGIKATEMALLGVYTPGALVDTTGFYGIAVQLTSGAVSGYRHYLQQTDMGEGKTIPAGAIGNVAIYSSYVVSIPYFTNTGQTYSWTTDNGTDIFVAPCDCKVYGIR